MVKLKPHSVALITLFHFYQIIEDMPHPFSMFHRTPIPSRRIGYFILLRVFVCHVLSGQEHTSTRNRFSFWDQEYLRSHTLHIVRRVHPKIAPPIIIPNCTAVLIWFMLFSYAPGAAAISFLIICGLSARYLASASLIPYQFLPGTCC